MAKTIKESLKNVLKSTVAKVVFTKLDGTERTMICTLNPEIIANKDSYVKKTDRIKANNTETLSVFDLEKNEWRSFKIANVSSVHSDETLAKNYE